MKPYTFHILELQPDAPANQFDRPAVGIDVLNQALSAGLNDNITDDSVTGMVALERAVTCMLPPDGTPIVAQRSDLHVCTAMALLLLRRLRIGLSTETLHRIGLIARRARDAGKWEGCALPTLERWWPEQFKELRHIDRVCTEADPLEIRVALAASWLICGPMLRSHLGPGEQGGMQGENIVDRIAVACGVTADMASFYDGTPRPALFDAFDRASRAVEKERHAMILGIDAGEFDLQEDPRGIAIVDRRTPNAADVGFFVAPVVVAHLPPDRNGRRKVTVIPWSDHYLDRPALVAALQSEPGEDPGWAAVSGMVRSPSAAGTTIALDRLVELVAEHLRKP